MNLEKLKKNERGWNSEHGLFAGWCALPSWGPFEIGTGDSSLLGEIRGKSILELCCGSGHSLEYLVNNGVGRAYGVDLSPKQIALAESRNAEAIGKGIVQIWQTPMEQPLPLSGLDAVFSIYGIGWTIDPAQTFRNVFGYLKPGGTFAWSWDHPIFCVSKLRNGTVTIETSAHLEQERNLRNWGTDDGVFLTQRKIATWFRLLREAGFVVEQFLEPEPVNIDEDIAVRSEGLRSYYDKKKAAALPVSFIFVCRKPIA